MVSQFRQPFCSSTSRFSGRDGEEMEDVDKQTLLFSLNQRSA